TIREIERLCSVHQSVLEGSGCSTVDHTPPSVTCRSTTFANISNF
ncbi:hypothetical protein Y032_0175g527, partial [Ancylostoma ceylanicum]